MKLKEMLSVSRLALMSNPVLCYVRTTKSRDVTHFTKVNLLYILNNILCG